MPINEIDQVFAPKKLYPTVCNISLKPILAFVRSCGNTYTLAHNEHVSFVIPK